MHVHVVSKSARECAACARTRLRLDVDAATQPTRTDMADESKGREVDAEAEASVAPVSSPLAGGGDHVTHTPAPAMDATSRHEIAQTLLLNGRVVGLCAHHACDWAKDLLRSDEHAMRALDHDFVLDNLHAQLL